MNGNKHVFPDSRLKSRPDFESIMGEWEMPDGTTVRCEQVPIYCVGCGKKWGHVPRDNTVQATFICQPCLDKDPHAFDGMVASDEEFCRDVQFEMESRYGRALTDLEVLQQLEQGKLSRPLELLEKESPYLVYRKD